MISTPTARWAFSALSFILVLLFSSAFDIALVSGICIFVLLGRIKPKPIFIAAAFVFILYLIFNASDFTIRFISDLSIDAYLLFVSSVILYLRSHPDREIVNFKHLQLTNRSYFSQKSLIALAAGFLVFLLLSPITGGYIASIIGYGGYAYLTRRFNGKIAVVIALVLLVLAVTFLLFRQTAIAEEIGNYTYFFLTAGTIQEVINLVRARKPPVAVKLQKLARPHVPLPSFHLSSGFRLVVFGSASFIFAFIAILLLLPKISAIPKKDLTSPNIVSATPQPFLSPSPPPTLKPLSTPTPILIASATAELSVLPILVHNGTDITGLAASTAAKLRSVGFNNVEIGNAPGDYDRWEIALNKYDENLVNFIKKTLDLSQLSSSEATIPAKFDVLIIIGRDK